MGGGGSSGVQRSESKVTQSNLPEYVRPYYERLLTRAESASREPYQAFPGPRLAGPGRDTLVSEDLTRDLAAAPAAGFDSAYNIFGQQASRATPFDRGIVSAYDPSRTSFMYRDPRMEGIASFNDPRRQTQSYLNPYIENVLDVQQKRARERFSGQEQQRAKDAVSSGAFGNSRYDLTERQRAKEFERELSDQESASLASGYSQAQELAANQQKYYTDMQNKLYSDAMNRAAEQQVRQIAAQESQTRLGFDAGKSLAGLDPSLQKYGMERVAGLRLIGSADEARDQAALDLGYADFARQRDYPKENLNYLSQILQGTAVAGTDKYQTSYKPKPNPYNALLGLGTFAAGQGMV